MRSSEFREFQYTKRPKNRSYWWAPLLGILPALGLFVGYFAFWAFILYAIIHFLLKFW